MTVTHKEAKLTESQAASLQMLRAMGRGETESLEYVRKDEQRRKLETALQLTEAELGSRLMLAALGRTETQALPFIERGRGRTLTEHGGDNGLALRRSAFAGMEFRPLRQARSMSSIARILTAHNAKCAHDEQCCPACAARLECHV
jgi:hypothetical protein